MQHADFLNCKQLQELFRFDVFLWWFNSLQKRLCLGGVNSSLSPEPAAHSYSAHRCFVLLRNIRKNGNQFQIISLFYSVSPGLLIDLGQPEDFFCGYLVFSLLFPTDEQIIRSHICLPVTWSQLPLKWSSSYCKVQGSNHVAGQK